MVSDPFHINDEDLPPPADEAWWAAVLAEDETEKDEQGSEDTELSISASREFNNHDGADPLKLDWDVAIQVYEQDQVIDLEVSGCNRGGLLVKGDGLQGFVPISHLVDMPCDQTNIEEELEKYVDQMLPLKIIECDRERGRVVFSERAALAEPGSRKYLLENLKHGSCITGKVTNITDFGVFVDLGGVEGLVHVSELSWGRVHHPADVVALGEEIKVFVIQVDQERARVALSIKRLHANPWESVSARYHTGQITNAVVTSIVPFGAFARLEEGLDGLIHVSEMFEDSPEPHDPRNLLSEGQELRVRILHVDANRQRLGLSLNLDGYE